MHLLHPPASKESSNILKWNFPNYYHKAHQLKSKQYNSNKNNKRKLVCQIRNQIATQAQGVECPLTGLKVV